MSNPANDLVGVWGFHTGYAVNPNEIRISFAPDGTGYINPHDDRLGIQWTFDPEAWLSLFCGGRWMGPFQITLALRDLPLGRFESLISDREILPFGLRQFQRMSHSPAP